MADRIHLAREGSVGVITLARPEKRNALDGDMLAGLERICGELEKDEAIRAAVLTGTGTAFSSGGDILAWSEMPPRAFGRDWVRLGHRVFRRLATLRMPLIAALNGDAFGGGLELAGVADIRIAERQAWFGLPETRLGMVPGWSGTHRLVRRFGAQAVRRMALGGEFITAGDAKELGIVDRVVGTGEALGEATAYARRVAERGPVAVEVTKLMIAIAAGEDDGEAVEALGSVLVAKTGDLSEGVAAFRAKRKPDFMGEW